MFSEWELCCEKSRDMQEKWLRLWLNLLCTGKKGSSVVGESKALKTSRMKHF